MASAFFSSNTTAPPAIARQAPSPSGSSASVAQQSWTSPLPQRRSPQQPVSAGTGSRPLPTPAQTWRPPATRRFLWDRGAQGPAVVCDLGNTKVQLEVQHGTWKLLQRLQQGGGGGTVALTARLGATSEGGVHMEFCTGQPSAADVAVPVVLGSGALEQQDQLARAGQLSKAYEVACSKQQGTGAAQLLQASCSLSTTADGSIALHGLAGLPAAIVTFRPILAKSVAPQPLAKVLQDTLRSGVPCPFQDGLLSMDQGRSLVPLAADDPVAYSVPLVGVWAAGAHSVRHPQVAAACLKFLCSKALADKALELDRSFLLLLYCQGKGSVPLCFECHVGLDSSGAVPLRAAFFSAQMPAAEQNSTTSAITLCELAPSPEVCMPGCPISIGARHVQGASAAAVGGTGERLSTGWQTGSRQHSPGSAGSTLSISSALPNSKAFLNTTALRLGESPNILPLPPASQVQQLNWHRPSEGAAGSPVSAPWGLPAGVVAVAGAPLQSTSPVLPSSQSSAAQGHSSLPSAEPPDTPAGVSTAGAPAAEAAAAQRQSNNLPLMVAISDSAGEPASLVVPGEAAACYNQEGSGTCSTAEDPGGSKSKDAGKAGSDEQQRALSEEEHHLACEPTEWSCREECSGSMPSFAGWSTTAQPEEKAPGSISSRNAGDTAAAKEAAPFSPVQQQPEQQEGGKYPTSSASSAPGTSCLSAGDASWQKSAAATAAAEIEVKSKPATYHPLMPSMNCLSNGALWACQPAPDVGLTKDVAVLQQEVVMLRQQVQMLQFQLHAVQAMQAGPAMVQHPIYCSPWAPLPGMHWPPPPQLALPLFRRGPAPPAPAASVQHSCSAATNPDATPTSAAASPQGSQQAASAADSDRGTPVPPKASGGSLIPAYRSSDAHMPGSQPQLQQVLPEQRQHGKHEAVPCSPSNTPPPDDACGVPLEVPAAPAALVVHPSAASMGPAGSSASSSSRREPEESGMATSCRMSVFQPATDVAAAAVSEGPPGFTDAEADIDRLIADAERAVSVLSCHSCHGSDEEANLDLELDLVDGAGGLPCSRYGGSCNGGSGGGGGSGSTAAGAGQPAASPSAHRSLAAALPSVPPSFNQRSSGLVASNGSATSIPGVVRVKVPSFLECNGSAADEDDEEAERLERLEQKYRIGRWS